MFRILIAVLVLGLCVSSGKASAQSVTIFAASSLTDAIDAVAKAYTSRTGVAVKTSFAASSALARQIENGAAADIFFSADEDWMAYLEKRGFLEPGTRVPRLSNRLVLVSPAGAPRKLQIRKGVDLSALLGPNGRIATGDPASVPVGRYAQQALVYLGLWDVVGPRLARAENVRVALLYVERGEAPLGIVYATDAAISRGVQVSGEFPPESHAPITYPVAIVARHANRPVRDFHAFLAGADTAPIFTRFGFTVK